jgi:hypothetical protein
VIFRGMNVAAAPAYPRKITGPNIAPASRPGKSPIHGRAQA